MKAAIILGFLGISTSARTPSGRDGSIIPWEPPGKGDERSPCPLLNALANHHILPHDGKMITRDVFMDAIFDTLHVDHDFGDFLFNIGLLVNPEPDPTFFTLGQLSRHGIIEHDASLSRQDAYYGNNHDFNQTIFDQSKEYWTGSTVTTEMLASSKLARLVQSKAWNPCYTYTTKEDRAGLAEAAAPIVIFGDTIAGTVNRDLLVYLFEKERLPFELGWTRKDEVVTKDDLFSVGDMIRDGMSFKTNT